MPTVHRTELKNIRTFPQLVRYLRDEMNWPIEQNSFENDDDLYYDFTPEELGLDTTTSAKIEQIRRLKRLSANQPWGIFFVKFEPGRLPVIALRRILSQVVLKKRATAKAAERAAWAADDLLFVSNYGEGGERQICFAHFSQSETRHDLPTLKVLGWDNLDTPLHLAAAAEKLTTNLAWPEDDTDIEAWRKNWRSAFVLRHREVVTTSHDLSIRLAELARAIRDRIKTALAHETEHGQLTKLMKAFQESLVHDLDAAGFADMYAQTIAYGLLSARIADPHKKTTDDFAAHMRTNPFLKELMQTFLHVGGRRGKAGGPGIDFDELGVNEVVELLDDANLEAVVMDFGDLKPEEDPVIHFYELFLKEYDAKKRMQRGVFYTPRPVVAYIVRSVDELLRSEFGLADGLADTATWGDMAKCHKDLKIPEGVPSEQAFVQILDPAAGTGTFLVEVIDLIHKTLVAKWKAQGRGEKKIEALWNEYVPQRLLPRLHGYELLMAPYAIAHLKIGLKLYETGYRFGSDERARIYLTNALEPAHDFSDTFEFAIPALAHEAQAVNEIKKKQRFTVVIGNPPYSAVSSNNGAWISNLIDAYKEQVRGEETQIRTLSDDYVKFLRLSHWLIESAGTGVVGMITNSNFTDGILFRGMRERLLMTFRRIALLDLHGHGRRSRSASVAREDENVFDILVGTSISLLARYSAGSRAHGIIVRADVIGSRSNKYTILAGSSWRTTQWTSITPSSPLWLFHVQDAILGAEYAAWLPFLELWGTGNEHCDRHSIYGFGIKTQQDEFAIAFDTATVAARVRKLLAPETTEAALRTEFRLCKTNQWSFAVARRRLGTTDWRKMIVPILYRPFDVRFTCYVPDVVTNPRPKVMAHLLGSNVAILLSRQVGGGDWRHVSVAKHLVDNFTVSLNSKEGCHVFPLFDVIGENEDISSQGRLTLPGGGRRSHLNAKRTAEIARAFGLRWAEAPSGEAGKTGLLTPNDIFHYAYAVFHSPGYRSRYAEFLKIDFPRLPLTESLELFRALARLGGKLVALHLMESPKLDQFITTYTGPMNPDVRRVGWSSDTVWLDAAATKKGQPSAPGTIGFRGVPEAVWNFHIGGYQVCEKWLKDRKGRTLSKDDLAHYQKIVVALNETIRLMKEIDEVIEQHGGWPRAFQTGEAQAAASKVIPFRPRIVQPGPKERYVTCVPLVPLKAAAGAFSDPQHIDDDRFEWAVVETKRRLRPGMFVAQIVGKSMEPAIPDGAYCLFAAPVEGTRQGKTVLVQLRDATDPESGERYTVKRYESEKVARGDSWRHARITLKPNNPNFESIVLNGADEGQLQVVAEFVEVLGRKS